MSDDAATRERRKAANQRYLERYPERHRARQRKWRAAHPRDPAYMKRWRAENPELVRAADRARHRREADTRNADSRERKRRERAADPARARERGRQYAAQRSARKRGASCGDPALALDYALVVLDDACSYCGAPADQADHIVALACGGAHDWENFTGACGRCNRRKHTKSLLNFLLELLP